MVTKERSIISREGTKNLNLHTPLQKSRSNDRHRHRESFELRIREMGPVFRPRFTDEDDEFSHTFTKSEFLDHENCMWLSSGGAPSPSSCSQHGSFGYMDLKIDAWFISLLSTPSPRSRSRSVPFLSTEVAFFDGSRSNPIEEAYSVLDQTNISNENVVFKENLEEEEVVSWLVTSIKNECSDGDADSSSLLTGSTPDKSVSSITDSSDNDNHSMFSTSSSSDYSSEALDLDEPLFWPFDSASKWSSETKYDLFVMSPRKKVSKGGNFPKASQHILNPRVPKLDSENCNKRLSDLKKANTIRRLSDLKKANHIRRTKSMPSRFQKPTTTTKKILPDFGPLTDPKTVNETTPTSTTMSSRVVASEDTKTKSPVFWPLGCGSPTDLKTVDKTEKILPDSRPLTDSKTVDKTEPTTSSTTASEDTNTKSPVFWPFGCGSDWVSDKWDFFIMSPPKTSPDPLKLQVVSENTKLSKGCSRRLEFSPGSESLTNVKDFSMDSSVKTVPETEVLARKPVGKHKILLEDLLLVDKLSTEGAIEDVLGLGEFDGHEGVESGFDENYFSLVEI